MIRKTNFSSRHFCHRLLLAIFVVLGLSCTATAEEPLVDPDVAAFDGKVEVEYLPQSELPFKERKTNWTFLFGLGQEQVMPLGFTSSKDQSTYSNLFGENPVRIQQVTAGIKYNTSIGGLSAEGVLSSGTLRDNRSGLVRSLSLQKRGLQVGWVLDALTEDQLFTPYINGQLFELDYLDKGSASGNSSGTTAPALGYGVGILIKLNSLDPTDTAIVAHRAYGLNNTFIDIFLSEYNASSDNTDPQLQTATNWGIGLKLEF